MFGSKPNQPKLRGPLIDGFLLTEQEVIQDLKNLPSDDFLFELFPLDSEEDSLTVATGSKSRESSPKKPTSDSSSVSSEERQEAESRTKALELSKLIVQIEGLDQQFKTKLQAFDNLKNDVEKKQAIRS